MRTGRGVIYCLIALWISPLCPAAFAQSIPHSWTRQFGTAGDDFALGAASDATDIYAAGYQNDTDLAPPNPCRTGAESLNVEAFLRKYTSAGAAASGFSSTPIADEIARGGVSEQLGIGHA